MPPAAGGGSSTTRPSISPSRRSRPTRAGPGGTRRTCRNTPGSPSRARTGCGRTCSCRSTWTRWAGRAARWTRGISTCRRRRATPRCRCGMDTTASGARRRPAAPRAWRRRSQAGVFWPPAEVEDRPGSEFRRLVSPGHGRERGTDAGAGGDQAMKAPGHQMILASAGSGKTYALTNRFVWLLARGARPERIAALTFTRKAAGEFFDEILKKLARAADDPAYAREIAGQDRNAGARAGGFQPDAPRHGGRRCRGSRSAPSTVSLPAWSGRFPSSSGSAAISRSCRSTPPASSAAGWSGGSSPWRARSTRRRRISSRPSSAPPSGRRRSA